MKNLKAVLFEEYDGFSDKRIKKLESGKSFIVDDRSLGSFDAQKKLFLWFCAIYVDVESDSEISIRLIGGVPLNAKIKAWIKKNKFELAENMFNAVLTIKILQGEQSKLLELAASMKEIVAPGESYSTAAYKYVCPNTAKSLQKLNKVLSSVWGN